MTAEFGSDPTLRSYAQLVRKRKWWVIALALAGLAVSLAISFTEPKEYTASAQVLVQPASQASALGATQQPVTATDVQTMMQLVTSAPVVQAVRGQLGSVPSVTAAEVAQTNVIAITAVAGAPARAAVVANAYAGAFVKYHQAVALTNLAQAEAQLRGQIRSIARQLKQLRGTPGTGSQQAALVNQEAVLSEQLTQMQVDSTGETSGLVLVTPAQAPASPSSPKPTENGLLGLAAGLILGLAALPPNPAELLNGRRIQEVFSALRGLFDLVLIDSPPVLPVTDSVLLAAGADATLLIVAAGQTSRGDLQRAAEKLAQVIARVVGMVLNETPRQGGGYGYGYGGSYATDKSLLGVPAQLNGSDPASHRGGSRRAR